MVGARFEASCINDEMAASLGWRALERQEEDMVEVSDEMEMKPDWLLMDAARRYEHLGWCRERWCARARVPDWPGRVLELDGRLTADVCCFFLHLGEKVNGPEGYFGADLHSLQDCFCGGFGLTHPITIVWNHAEQARAHLGAFAWEQFVALGYVSLTTELSVEELADLGYFGEDSPEDADAYYRSMLLAGGTPRHDDSYFEQVCAVFQRYARLELL